MYKSYNKIFIYLVSGPNEFGPAGWDCDVKNHERYNMGFIVNITSFNFDNINAFINPYSLL